MNAQAVFAEAEIDPAVIAAQLADEHPADIVEKLNDEIPQVAAAVLLNFPLDRAIEVMDTPGLNDLGEIICAWPRDKVVPLLNGMSSDRVADLFRQLDHPSKAICSGVLIRNFGPRWKICSATRKIPWAGS